MGQGSPQTPEVGINGIWDGVMVGVLGPFPQPDISVPDCFSTEPPSTQAMNPTNTCDLPPQAGRYDCACLERHWVPSLMNPVFLGFQHWQRIREEERVSAMLPHTPQNPLVRPSLTQMFCILYWTRDVLQSILDSAMDITLTFHSWGKPLSHNGNGC